MPYGYKRKARKTTKPRTTRRARTTGAKSMRATIQKVMQRELEKKRFTICPQANAVQTVGDIITNAPINASIAGGNFGVAGFGASPGPFILGQSYNTNTVSNTGGWASIDITPIPLQSNETNGRVGSQITLNSAFIKLQFQQQSNASTWAFKVKVLVVENLGPSVSASQAMTDMWQNNPFTYSSANTAGFIDYNSTRQPDNFKNYRVIRQQVLKVPIDTYYAVGALGALQIKESTMKIKFNRGKGHRVRYLQNNTANLTANVSAGQLFLMMLVDYGQTSAQTQLTDVNRSIVGNQLAQSGLLANFHLTHYFTDA